jgi:dihydroneopterin aldolase
MTARVLVANLCVFGRHGVGIAEQSLGQKFYIDMECVVDRPNPADDRIEATVCYGALCDLAENLSVRTTFNLIETFARAVAQQILADFPLVRSVRVQVRKPSAPIRQAIDWVGAEVECSRGE